MKKLLFLAMGILFLAFSVVPCTAENDLQNMAKKIKQLLPEGWTVTEKSDGIKMYARAAQSLEIEDHESVPGSLFTITNTKATVPKDAAHNKEYNPYFEVYVYKLALTEEQIIKYNRLANAMYNRPAGTQDEFPPRFVTQKGEYIVMKSPSWGKAASPGIDNLLLKVISLVKKELP